MTALGILGVLALLVANAFFVIAEYALLTAPRAQVEVLAQGGSRGAAGGGGATAAGGVRVNIMNTGAGMSPDQTVASDGSFPSPQPALFRNYRGFEYPLP